ncbi:MAG TPA: GNAT family N-acetyltransferase [Waddliaceae bacterium]
MTEIQQASTLKQIKQCYKLMRQLRPHLVKESDFIEQVQRQITSGYCLVYLAEHKKVKALAGFRFLEFLAWGKILYIDDLVTDSEARGSGYGSKLLKWVIEQGRIRDCDQVHLDSGVLRHDAHRLYLNHRFIISGHHFALHLREF